MKPLKIARLEIVGRIPAGKNLYRIYLDDPTTSPFLALLMARFDDGRAVFLAREETPILPLMRPFVLVHPDGTVILQGPTGDFKLGEIPD